MFNVTAATGAITLTEGASGPTWLLASGLAVGVYTLSFSAPQAVDALVLTTLTNAVVYIYFA